MHLGSTFLFFAFLSLQSFLIRAQVVDIVQTAINRNFTTLVAAVSAASLVNTLKSTGPFTVFAPTDAAFGQLPAGVVAELVKPENNRTLNKILLYHVASGNTTSTAIAAMTLPTNVPTVQGGTVTITRNGSTIRVNSANVIVADVFATNGIIHAIDKVLLPGLDIVETAVTNGAFKTLVAALRAADLIGALQGPGPFTVFAPNDAAFAKLTGSTLNDLLKPENKDKLANILKYHVISRRVAASDISALTLPANVTMLGGGAVTITRDGANLKVNGATIIATDVSTTNGLIHVIDTVLMPPGTTTSGVSRSFNQGFLSILILTIIAFIL